MNIEPETNIEYYTLKYLTLLEAKIQQYIQRNIFIQGVGWGQSGPGQPAAGPHSSQPQPGGTVRRHRMGAIVGWRDWRRNDPTVLNSLWKSKTPLGNKVSKFMNSNILKLF